MRPSSARPDTARHTGSSRRSRVSPSWRTVVPCPMATRCRQRSRVTTVCSSGRSSARVTVTSSDGMVCASSRHSSKSCCESVMGLDLGGVRGAHRQVLRVEQERAVVEAEQLEQHVGGGVGRGHRGLAVHHPAVVQPAGCRCHGRPARGGGQTCWWTPTDAGRLEVQRCRGFPAGPREQLRKTGCAGCRRSYRHVEPELQTLGPCSARRAHTPCGQSPGRAAAGPPAAPEARNPATAAADMASSGGSSPVQCRKASAALVDQHAEAVDHDHLACPCCRHERRREGVVDHVDDELARRQQLGRERQVALGPAAPRAVEGSASAPGTSATTGGATPAMPTGVAFTTRSAAATSLIAPTRPTGPASTAARSARAAVRLTTVTSDAPAVAGTRARGTRRAPRPDHHAPATLGVEPLVDPRASRAGLRRRCCAPRPGRRATPRSSPHQAASAFGRPLVDGREGRLLVRHGHR